jgi:hypothetical protein
VPEQRAIGMSEMQPTGRRGREPAYEHLTCCRKDS